MIALPQLLRLAVLVHQESPSACLMAHASPASSVDDCRKSQTSAATPAEPGDLPWGLVSSGTPQCTVGVGNGSGASGKQCGRHVRMPTDGVGLAAPEERRGDPKRA